MSTGKDDLVPFGIGSAQYNFTVNDLAKASNNKEIKWIMVYGYRPFYSSPTAHPASESMRDIYHPLFQKYGVDLVITTHNHNYQRTYPLEYNESSSSHPIVVDRHTDNYNQDRGGTIFLTIGTGGEDVYRFLAKAPFVVTQFEGHGFLNVDLAENGKKLVGTFYNNVEGAKDHFTILKKGPN